MSYSIEQRDEQLTGTSANITYTLSFDRAPQHLVQVTMRVDKVEGDTLTLVMPVWSPGSYKVRDYAGYQGNVVAYTVSGGQRTEARMSWRDKTSLVVDTNGADSIEVEYVVYGLERTVRTNHINRFHAFLIPTATCMYVEGRTDEIHHVLLKHDQKLWPNVSTQLSPVREANSEGVLLGALNYDLLADSPLEIGDHVVRAFDVNGARHEFALAANQALDADWLVGELKTIVETEAALFGELPYDRYVFILQCYPNTYGGLEHARSSVNAVDPGRMLDKGKAKQLLSLLCHEFFHLWNVKRIRPAELGPFDYTKENYTPALWLAEGVTSYYDDLLSYRCGFQTREEYLTTLSKDHLTRMMQVPGRFQMSTRDSSYLSWVKLYMQSPDGTNRFPSYYLKGGITFLLLDLYIIDHTDGKASMDDGLRGLWKRYKDNPAEGVSEDECIAILERSTGVQLRDRLMTWLSGTDELPYNEVFAPIGLEMVVEAEQTDPITFGEERGFASVPSPVFTGLGLKVEDGALRVRTLLDGSPAQHAGIGIDDEILAVNGKRVTNATLFGQLIDAEGQKPVELTCHCDGRLYTTTMTPSAKMKATLKIIEDPTDRQKQLQDVWLHRPA